MKRVTIPGMSLNELSTLRLVTDTALVMLIWLVQLVIYPSFSSIEPARFIDWHHRYMRTISFIVIPLMLVQAALIGVQCINAPIPAHLISTAAVLAAWGATFTMSVPCHRKLQLMGKTEKWIDRLVRTNWIRTVAWSLAWLSLWFPHG